MTYYILTSTGGGFQAFRRKEDAEECKALWEEEIKLRKGDETCAIEETDTEGYWLAFQKQWEKEEKR